MSTEKELKPTMSDYGHKIIKTALATVPVAGNILSELFTTLVAEPSSKRRDQLLINIDRRLNELTSKIDKFDVDALSTNDVFLSTVSQAYQIAMRTHQEEKIESLLNAISNSAISDLDENLQHMFLMFIDSFTAWHLRILLLIDNPERIIAEMGRQNASHMGSISQLILSAYPELRGQDEFIKQIWKDLYNRGLTNINETNLKTMTSGNGMLEPKTSELGKTFLQFITNHL
jgi:hypothetical protein